MVSNLPNAYTTLTNRLQVGPRVLQMCLLHFDIAQASRGMRIVGWVIQHRHNGNFIGVGEAGAVPESLTMDSLKKAYNFVIILTEVLRVELSCNCRMKIKERYLRKAMVWRAISNFRYDPWNTVLS